LSILKASSATVNNGQFKSSTLSTALAEINASNDLIESTIRSGMSSDKVFLYNSHQGDTALKNSALIVFSYGSVNLLFPTYRTQAEVYNDITGEVKTLLNDVLPGAKTSSSIYRFKIQDKNNQTVTSFAEKIYVKVPYSGIASSTDKVAILYLSDGSTTIKQLDNSNILSVQPQSDLSDGYIIFSVHSLGYFIAMDQ